ncbi:MAG: transglutaminase domain-containing protein [Anaerolineae bacterium]|nr:transglutaminase domain-containing protein [Anaerolineae bacterium]
MNASRAWWVVLVACLVLAACQAALSTPAPETTPMTPPPDPTHTRRPLPSATVTRVSQLAPSPTAQPPTASPTPSPSATATQMTTPAPTPTSTTAQRYLMRYEIEHPTVLGTQTLVEQLWLPLPNTDGNGTREFDLVDVYPQGYQLLDIGDANRAAYWEDVPGLCSQTDCRFGIAFRVTLERPMYAIPWSEAPSYDREGDLYQTYTAPERGIASDDPDLRALAQRIVGDESVPYKQVLLIQSWIQQNVRYPDLGSTYPDDALQCIDAGVGDCAGQSKVFVALCRALGIPARTVSGLRPFAREVGRLDQFGPRAAWFENTLDVHVWCEVYYPALGWVQCEPDMPGYGIDKERLITKRGPFAFPGGLCQQATYLHLPLAVHGDWCGQTVGWEVSIDAQPLD